MIKKALHITGFILAVHSTAAQSQNITDAQHNLQQLNRKIAVLQKNLHQTQNKQTHLQHELSSTVRQIKQNELNLHLIQQKIPLKELEIDNLGKKIAEFQRQFEALQALLIKQIQIRYQQRPNQPIEWFLNHPKKNEIQRILAYYQYILHSQEQTLYQLQATQHELQTQQAVLRREIQTLHHLQVQARMTQQQLQTYKHHHEFLLQNVGQQIASQENTLSEYQRNRDNLSQILNKLGRESVIQTRHSMTTMKRKLPYPVEVESSHIQKIHQGVMLYSAENSPVHAVYPGKIVFGEWLNGYGLLIIVDHGWGLMTLYANNHHLIKQVGDIVSQGEPIATVGHGGIAKQAGLYFEVRKHGKAISPLEWLGSKKR